jgi:cytochrome b561
VAAIRIVESGGRAAGPRRLRIELILCAVALAGLVRDSWPGLLHLPAVNLHAIFGALLWLAAVAQFSHANLADPPLSGTDVRELCRGLARRIYLLLYVVFGLSQLVRIAAILWNSTAQGSWRPATLAAPENLRDYLAYGVFALLTLHVLAALRHSSPSTLAHHQHDK